MNENKQETISAEQKELRRELLNTASLDDEEEEIERLVAAGVEVNFVDGEISESPLMVAAGHGNDSNIKALLAAGADPNLTNAEGTNALMEAAAMGWGSAVEILLETGVNVNTPQKEEHGGLTALMLAAGAGRLAAVKVLLAAGADPSIKSPAGKTALELAKKINRKKNHEVVAELSAYEKNSARSAGRGTE